MAFVKLFPPEGGESLSLGEIVGRLRDEFTVVDTDPDAGRDHVGDMIVATMRFSDNLPHKQQQLTRLRAAQDDAVYVTFGDSLDVTAACCLLPDDPLFFGYPDEVDGPARTLVERAAKVLGYEVYEG